MFPELSLCVNGQESEYPFSVNAYESEYSKFDESGNINESGKISSSVNVVSMTPPVTASIVWQFCVGYSLREAEFLSLKNS